MTATSDSDEEELTADELGAGTNLDTATVENRQRRSPTRGYFSSAALYGANQVDQEVSKLVLGQPHRLEVLASRAPDDRRAIETSLLKALSSVRDTNDIQERARRALEDYGFVARQCAALLFSPVAFDRSSAARTLGEIKSHSALPFLIEALYDGEAIVRNQAIASIGELKEPSAIGALLDLARRHPEVPGSLLSRSLSACSLEELNTGGNNDEQPVVLPSEVVIHDITELEPLAEIEELPETIKDEALAMALAHAEKSDYELRVQAIRNLGNYRSQSAVKALSSIVRSRLDPGVRALAISSLASINHPSVFPAALVGMADSSREVRAASARCLNRLSFDRADAYVRVMETSDDDTIREVSQACIDAGIVSQAIDRLATSDRRQAYEAFSLVSMLLRADLAASVFDAVSTHPSLDVRLSAVRLLAGIGNESVVERLQSMAIDDELTLEVKTALMEALYRRKEFEEGAQTDSKVIDDIHRTVEGSSDDRLASNSRESGRGLTAESGGNF